MLVFILFIEIHVDSAPGGGELHHKQLQFQQLIRLWYFRYFKCYIYRQNYNTTNQSDTGLTKVARDAYSATANKASNGTPSQFWVQRFIDKVTLTIYPLPNSTAASNFLKCLLRKKN